MASNTHCCRIRLSSALIQFVMNWLNVWLTLRVLQLSMQENLFGQVLLVELQVKRLPVIALLGGFSGVRCFSQ